MKRLTLICLIGIQVLVCYSQPPTATAIKIPADTTSQGIYLVRDVEVQPIKETNRLVIHWKVATNVIPEFFMIERSNNGAAFEVIAILKSSAKVIAYEWIDEAPLKGKNEYRIRCNTGEGDQMLSKSVTAQVTGLMSFKFYPNPVDNILIIRTEIPIDIHIVDASGKVRITQNRIQGLRTLNVSSLEPGAYLLRVTNTFTNAVNQEKLIKN